MDLKEGTGRVASEAFDVLKSAPLAITLLVLNAGFLWFGAYVLGQLATNTAQRDKAQVELINSLVNDVRDCHGGTVK